MKYKVDIKTIANNTYTADDSLVARQGSAAYLAIVNKRDVVFNNESGKVLVIPYESIVKASVTITNDEGGDDDDDRVWVEILDSIATTQYSSESATYECELTPTELLSTRVYKVEFNNSVYEITAEWSNDFIYIGDDLYTRYPFSIHYDPVTKRTVLYTKFEVTSSPIAVYANVSDLNRTCFTEEFYFTTGGDSVKLSKVLDLVDDNYYLVTINGESYITSALEEDDGTIYIGDPDLIVNNFYIITDNNEQETTFYSSSSDAYYKVVIKCQTEPDPGPK